MLLWGGFWVKPFEWGQREGTSNGILCLRGIGSGHVFEEEKNVSWISVPAGNGPWPEI